MNDSTAIVGSYVQTLHLEFDPAGYATFGRSMFKEQLPEVLSKFSNVKTFTLAAGTFLDNLPWDQCSPALQAAVESIITSSRLIRLNIQWMVDFPINKLVEKSSFRHLRYRPNFSRTSPSLTPTRRYKTLRLKSLVYGILGQPAILDVVNACSPEGESLFDWTDLQVLDFSIDQKTNPDFARTILSKCVNLTELKCSIFESSYLSSFLDPIYASHRPCHLRTITIDVRDVAPKNQVREFAIGLDHFPRDNNVREFNLIFHTKLVDFITVEELADVLDGGIALFNNHFKKEVFSNLESLTIQLVADSSADSYLIESSADPEYIEVDVEKWFPSLKAQYGRGFQFSIVPFA